MTDNIHEIVFKVATIFIDIETLDTWEHYSYYCMQYKNGDRFRDILSRDMLKWMGIKEEYDIVRHEKHHKVYIAKECLIMDNSGSDVELAPKKKIVYKCIPVTDGELDKLSEFHLNGDWSFRKEKLADI